MNKAVIIGKLIDIQIEEVEKHKFIMIQAKKRGVEIMLEGPEFEELGMVFFKKGQGQGKSDVIIALDLAWSQMTNKQKKAATMKELLKYLDLGNLPTSQKTDPCTPQSSSPQKQSTSVSPPSLDTKSS
jgi:hypothetical protein